MTDLHNLLSQWFIDQPVAWTTIRTLFVLLTAWASFHLARTILLRWIGRLIRSSRTDLDDVLLDRSVLRRAALLAPVMVLYYGVEVLPGPTPYLLQIVNAALAIVLMLLVGASIDAFQDAISEYDARSDVPIKSYAQIVKILIYVVGALMTIALLTGKSPWVLLSGVGALMAAEQWCDVFTAQFSRGCAHFKSGAVFSHLRTIHSPIIGFAETHGDHRCVAALDY